MENKNNYYPRKSNNISKTGLIIIIIGAVLNTVLWVTLIWGAVQASPTEQPREVVLAYEIDYVYHVVEPGDSLSYIAEKYVGEYPGSFLQYQGLIMNLNEIDNPNRIMVGDIIQVPVYKSRIMEY